MPVGSTRHLATHRELTQQFAAADRNDDGRIDFGEFTRLLEGLEASVTQEMQIGFHDVDVDRDGLIDCRESTGGVRTAWHAPSVYGFVGGTDAEVYA